MKIRNKILSLFLCAALLICSLPVTAAAASDFPTVLAEAKKGVVQIYGVGQEGIYISSWVGTGFAVGESGKDSDVFLTNWHVVTAEGDYSLSQVKIWILQEDCQIDDRTLEPDPNRSITCEVLKTTNGSPDYAILRATEPVSGYKPLPLLPSEQVPDGETVYALGYPAIVSDFSKSHYGIDDITSTNGIISQHMLDNTNINVLMHTAQISGGNSGGPLIDERGAVVGVNTWTITENDASVSIDIKYVRDILDDEDIPYAVYSGTNWMLIGIIGGLVALIAVVAVIIVVVSSRNKASQTPVMPAPSSVQPVSSYQPAGSSFQPTGYQPAGGSSYQAPQPGDGRPRLQCLYGAFSGKRFSLENSVRIGRDPGKNDLVFPQNTQGVSGVHCVLMVDGSSVWLKDLGSTYGTYVAGGRRLAANEAVQLQIGDKFWLGSENEVFVIAPKGGI